MSTTYPSDFDRELKLLQERIKNRLNHAAKDIIQDEVNKILGRVKIITHADLNGTYEWFIQRQTPSQENAEE